MRTGKLEAAGPNWQPQMHRHRRPATDGQRSCDVFWMTRDKSPQRLAVGYGQCQQLEAEGFGDCQKAVDEIHSIRKNSAMLLHCNQQ
jgi:hypothetical protein